MKRKLQKVFRNLWTAVLLCAMVLPVNTVQAAEKEPQSLVATINTYYDGGYSIMGPTTVTIGQMINYYQANQAYPAFYANTDAPNIYVFCMMYMEECNAEGVRAEVAFAQAMKETGFLRYGKMFILNSLTLQDLVLPVMAIRVTAFQPFVWESVPRCSI